MLLVPSAASWSRARHATSAARLLRSRAHPLGCPDLSAKDRPTTQDSNNTYLVAAWFADQAALQRVPFLFLCPEDFGGHSQHGPASPWSLVEFQRLSGFNDVWRGAAFMCRFAQMEHRHSTGMLTNIQGLRRSISLAWPLFREVQNILQYTGPLPKVCSCSVVHRDSITDANGFFHSAFSLSCSLSFWSRLFQDAWCAGHDTLRDGDRGLIYCDNFSLSSATGSWQPLYSNWSQGHLSRAILREYATSFLSSSIATSPAQSTRSRVASVYLFNAFGVAACLYAVFELVSWAPAGYGLRFCLSSFFVFVAIFWHAHTYGKAPGLV